MYASLVLLVGMTAEDPHVLLRMLTGMGIVALLNMLYYLRSERSLDFVYGALYTYFAFFTLSWRRRCRFNGGSRSPARDSGKPTAL